MLKAFLSRLEQLKGTGLDPLDRLDGMLASRFPLQVCACLLCSCACLHFRAAKIIEAIRSRALKVETMDESIMNQAVWGQRTTLIMAKGHHSSDEGARPGQSQKQEVTCQLSGLGMLGQPK